MPTVIGQAEEESFHSESDVSYNKMGCDKSLDILKVLGSPPLDLRRTTVCELQKRNEI